MSGTALSASQLCRRYDPAEFTFDDTRQLEDLTEPLGQDRAVEAIRFGVGIRHDGFNLFAFGPTGSGKREFVRRFLEEQAKSQPRPDDWCYVNNFSAPDRPKPLRLPPGRSVRLAKQMEGLAEELRVVIASAFESEDYRTRLEVILEHYKSRQEEAFKGLQEKSAEKNVTLMQTPVGLALAPLRDGKVIDPDTFSELPEAERETFRKDISELEGELQDILRMLPDLEREQRQEVRTLNREVTNFAIGHLIDEIREDWQAHGDVIEFLDAVQNYVTSNADVFRISTEALPPAAAQGVMSDIAEQREKVIGNCQVNVLVSHDENAGAPVVLEDHPTVENILGRIEQRAQYGNLVTDFRLIKSGALHQANGGYLILEARRLLMQPFSWETLKRVLRSGEIRVESLSSMLSLGGIESLRPETIPLDVKVVLIGDAELYYLLSRYDPDFHELFKVPIEFEDRLPVTGPTIEHYARLIATQARAKNLLPFDRDAVALIMQRMTRLADDAERLSNHTRSLLDLMQEAGYWATVRKAELVTGEDVSRAIDARIRRSSRIQERTREMIERGTIMIDTSGETVGQINALSVLQLGEFAFGRPSRVTARVRLGGGRVVDIEREVELGGPLHSKGVLILSNFLAARYTRNLPLSLNASLVFEQSYGGVDGDSASSTELYALLSALSELPIKQCFAVTGSVNQFGEVQAIGGVNEKIEGFFDLCQSRGLSGEQGVLIPQANIKHLMLKQEVVRAVEAGEFAVHAISTIDEGIEILTGKSAGKADAKGEFPPDSINGLVQARLHEFAMTARQFARPEDKNEEGKARK